MMFFSAAVARLLRPCMVFLLLLLFVLHGSASAALSPVSGSASRLRTVCSISFSLGSVAPALSGSCLGSAPLLLFSSGGVRGGGVAGAAAQGTLVSTKRDAVSRFVPPVRPLRLLRPFVRPQHRYGPGHRGVDLAAVPGQQVVAPGEGVVRFVGAVAGRPVVSVAFAGDGVYSLEPVVSDLREGDAVAAGQLLGVVGRGGDCDVVCVHFGVRVAGEYVNPALWLFVRPRLLPLGGGGGV